MMDGDRASVFKPDEVEVISAPEDAEVREYLVGTWVFSGSCCLTLGLRRWLPSRAVPVGTVLFGTVLRHGAIGDSKFVPVIISM